MKSIKSFTGEYDFLGNGFPSVVRVGEYEAPNVEYGFHMLKTPLRQEREWVLAATHTFGPDGAKSRGRSVTLRSDWDEPCSKHSACVGMKVKDAVMIFLLRQKFSNPILAERLLFTYEWDLEEGNNHGDRYWGTVNGEGENVLGTLLEDVRSELRVAYDFTEVSE